MVLFVRLITYLKLNISELDKRIEDIRHKWSDRLRRLEDER